jgi:hypothetical protein
MKKITLGLFFSLSFLIYNVSFGQCPGCHIDSSLNSPGIYPTTLPTGTQTVPYSEDVTFVMFLDTSGFAVNYFKIIGVSGLPFGLHWECNNAATGCQYDPNVNIRGCVKICGTPLQSGFFTIDVNLVVNLATVGNQNSTTQIFVQIDPVAGGNSGFTFSPAMSCDTALVNFDALIDGAPNPTVYNWNFGNGNTSTLQHPSAQLYSSPGDYVVSLQTDILGYKITDVNLFSVNSNWSGDVEEPSSTFFSPDPYFQIFNSLSTNLYTSASLSGTESGSWNSLNIILIDPPYSITIWDEDNISADDNLGSFPFSVSGTGTIPFSGAAGTSGNIVVASYVVQTFMNYDTVHVYPAPTPPSAISLSGNDTICLGDSVMLSVTGVGSSTIQWYNDTTSVVNGDTSSIMVNQAGNYWAQLTNANGCSSNSNQQNVFVAPIPYNPTFLISGNTLTCYTTGFQLQWYLNGNPIPGADSSVYVISVTGNYSIVATNSFGCTASSIVVLETYIGVDELDVLNHLVVFPNPSNGEFNISADQRIIGMNYTVTDNIGRVIIQGKIDDANTRISLSEFDRGVYFLFVKGESSKIVKLIRN